MQTIHGSCLCQQVQYQVTGHLNVFQYCHCSRCRKFTGSAHAANLLVKPEHFNWLAGEDKVSRFQPADTKHFATAFCHLCGSSLPWLAKTGKAMVIPAGTLDQAPDIQPQQNIFWDSKANWYRHANELVNYPQLPPRK